jgi:hypothetical protein
MANLKPEESFTPTLAKALGGDELIVVKEAAGGLPIRRWFKNWQQPPGQEPNAAADKVPNGNAYDRLLPKVKAAIAGKTPDTVTFVWMQGENDARMKWGEVYATSLTGLMAQLRTDLARQDINFVIGRISDFDNENKQYPHWTIVREAQVKVAAADPRAAWIDTDDLNGPKNNLHCTPEGYRILGERFATKALELLRKNNAVNPRP